MNNYNKKASSDNETIKVFTHSPYVPMSPMTRQYLTEDKTEKNVDLTPYNEKSIQCEGISIE